MSASMVSPVAMGCAHLAAGHRDLGDVVIAEQDAPAGEYLLEEAALLQRTAGGAAYVQQEAAYLGLEDDDYSQRSHVQQGAEQRGHHLESHRVREHAYHYNYYDGDEDVHRRSAPDPVENEIDDGRDHQYVQYVHPSEVEES